MPQPFSLARAAIDRALPPPPPPACQSSIVYRSRMPSTLRIAAPPAQRKPLKSRPHKHTPHHKHQAMARRAFPEDMVEQERRLNVAVLGGELWHDECCAVHPPAEVVPATFDNVAAYVAAHEAVHCLEARANIKKDYEEAENSSA